MKQMSLVYCVVVLVNSSFVEARNVKDKEIKENNGLNNGVFDEPYGGKVHHTNKGMNYEKSRTNGDNTRLDNTDLLIFDGDENASLRTNPNTKQSSGPEDNLVFTDQSNEDQNTETGKQRQTKQDKSQDVFFDHESDESNKNKRNQKTAKPLNHVIKSDTYLFVDGDIKDDNATLPMRANFVGGCQTGYVRAADNSCQEIDY